MINVDLIGGIGNNMFQYAIGRIFADKKNYNLHVNNIHQLQSYFINAVNIVDRQIYSDNTLHVGYNSVHKTIQHIDVEQVQRHVGAVHFSGFFQKFCYYNENINMLRDVFSYSDEQHYKPHHDDIVMHIRLGDYKSMNWYIHPEIFAHILKQMDTYNNCMIVTDEPDSVMFNCFKNFKNIHIINQSLIEDLTLIRHAKRLVISQSTFSWWGAILGFADNVYIPLSKSCKNYPWKTNPSLDEIDLVPEIDRFVKLYI